MNTESMNPQKGAPTTAFAWHVNQEHVRQLIDQAIADTPDGTSIPTTTARLIAATIHHGPGTALNQLASTGEINRLRAMEELEHTSAHDLPATWRTALENFLRTEADQ